MKPKKNAIILCAGSARRFFPEGASEPKCLLSLSPGKTILDGLIEPLLEREYSVVLGTGCGHDAVVSHLSCYDEVANGRLSCVFNPEYETTNSIVTLWRLRQFVGDQTLIVNGDSVVDPKVFDLFDENGDGTASNIPQLLVKHLPAFDDDTYRVRFDAKRKVIDMGKELRDSPSPNCAAFLGISRVGCAALFLNEIETLLQSGTRQTWPTTAYKNLIGVATARAVDIGNALSFDVDTVEEHEAAQRAVQGAA